ncbi:MAG: hypothetical protein KDE27_12490 [Planctomycetes bacterium]|nr:hypothetical protein [Planctomycetota bacterium]
MAKALGVHPRTIARLLGQGMPAPRKREGAAAWAKRAAAWRSDQKRKPGPVPEPKPEAKENAEARFRTAKAELAELDLARRRGEVHDRAECERAFVARCVEIRGLLANLPNRLASRLYQAPSPEAIYEAIEEELRRCLAPLQDG